MKKLLIIMSLMMISLTAMADTYLEDHLEDTLEAQYHYITDGNNNTVELDIDVREQEKNITVIVTIDDDSYNVKKSFNKMIDSKDLAKQWSDHTDPLRPKSLTS